MADHDDLPVIVIERRSSGFAPFIWGAVAGAVLGMLFAPRAGSETRREIRDGARRVRDSAESTVRNVQETVAGTVDDLRGQVTDQVDSARRAMEAGRQAARETRMDLERRVREVQSGFRASPHAAGGPPEDPTLADEDEFQS